MLSHRRIRAIGAIGTFVVGLGCAGSALALEHHVRDGWMAGLGIGYGPAHLQFGPQLLDQHSDWIAGTTAQLHFGHSLGSRWMLGFESRGWLDEQGFGSTKVRVGIQNFAATATWFPGDPANATGGLWLKAGAGIAQARITVFEDAAAGVDSSSFEAHIDDAGPGLLAGVGYEFRIVRSLAVGLDVTANYQPIHEAAFDTNWFVPVALSMHWYF